MVLSSSKRQPAAQARTLGHIVRAALVTGLLTSVCVGSAAADTAAPFVVGASQTTLPVWASASGVGIAASACGPAGSCVGTGYYEDASGSYAPLVVPVSDGKPGIGTLVQLPAGASATQASNLVGVSCWGASSCVAVGGYSELGNTQALVVPVTAGAPGVGTGITLPGNADPSPESNLSAVSCAASGSCVAAGSYRDASGNDQALVVPTAGATVGSGLEVTPPAGSAPSGSQVARLSDLSCWSAGDCIAVGSFKDANGDTQALVVPITGGAPGSAVAVTLPPDAAVAGSSTVPDAQLAKVSCWGTGSCVAVGSYATANNNMEGIVLPIVGGVPGTATAAPLPSNAPTAASSQSAGLSDVNCTAAGQCVAVGDYLVSPTDQEALVDPITNGVPGPAEAVSLPAGAVQGTQQAALQYVSCPPAGACAAAGYYADANGNQQELLDSITGGIAAAGFGPQAFANESTTHPTALSSVSCADSGSCVTFGAYVNTSNVQMPTVFSMQAPISLGTPGLPLASKGQSYQWGLSTAGAWGSYSWSLSSGSLPGGLSLNPQTGVITGTPTTTATATFTVEVTGTGSPLQTATRQFRIHFIGPPRPHVSVTSAALQVSESRARIMLGCTGANCQGWVKLEATETVILRTRVVVITGRGRHRRRHVRTGRRIVRRVVVIGAASYSLAAPGVGAATVVLNGSGRRLLAKAKAKRQPLPVNVQAVAAGGNHVARSGTLVQ